MRRGAGVLMHIASLPGPFGIGVFGEEAINFAAQLKRQGMKYWQVLPFSYPGMGNSPYQSFSAFAGNWLFIDPRSLMRRNLITSSEVVAAEYNVNRWRIDYDYLRVNREELLRKAFSRASSELLVEVEDFIKVNKWVDDVALYQAIKDDNCQKPWWEWQDTELRDYKKEALKRIRGNDNYNFHAFVQYIFVSEWSEIKRKINELGIEIIGDMPIYVSGDSSDIWANRDMFLMATEETKKTNPDLIFDKVAGVPPDYFCADGQLWGNPIYDWKKHIDSNFDWWMKRLEMNYCLYDYVRIDHFRAFSTYWEVPATALTAKEGVWKQGPGMKFFEAHNKYFGSSDRLIAEDLGDKSPDVDILLDECGLPRMKIMQFSFNPNDNSLYLPHNYEANCVAYTGTHDNNTLLGWLWEATEAERRECLEYCGFEGNNWGDGGTHSASCRAIIKTLWMSHANCVILPIQDMLGYGSDTRMNIPGTATGNWVVRFTSDDLNSIDDSWYSELNRLYRR